jgi:hypothetical protein
MIITVFDFDDTLFPTSHYVNKKKEDGELFEKHEIEKICNNIRTIYNISKNNSTKIHIITNAQISWIDMILNNYFSSCMDVFNNIEIISSVDEGFSENRDKSMWKTYTFIFKLYQYFNNNENHELISFGDCIFDREAAMNIKKIFPNVIVKNILLFHKPNLNEFLIEHDGLIKRIQEFYNYPNHLDYKIIFKNNL